MRNDLTVQYDICVIHVNEDSMIGRYRERV